MLLSKISKLSLVYVLICVASAAMAQPPDEPRVERATAGEYQHLWLRCEGGAESVSLFVGLRGGKSTTVWFVGGAVPGGVKATGAHRVLVDAHSLTFNDGRLAGTISVRQVSVWQPQHLAEVVIAVDARHSTNEVTGTWSGEVVGGKKSNGKIIGTLTREATIRSDQAIPTGVDWPNYHGPRGTNGSTDAAKWIDELALAKPVWKAEQPLLSGWGTGVDSRYTWRAAVGTVCGGSSTPVLANSRLYLFHYVPSGEPAADLVTKVLTDFERNSKRQPLPAERTSLVDYCRPLSDTIVTCIDAATGGTLWNATFPRLSGNYQTHKWRGINPTASVIGSTVIANDLAGNWVALDAAKGDVLWTIKTSQKVDKDSAALGAVQAGTLAILPSASGTARAVEPRTGKIVWQQPGGPQALVWGQPGAERVLFLNRNAPACRDVATGQLLWTLPENLVGHTGSAALIDGDLLVGHILPDPKQRGGFFQGWKLTDSGATKVWQDEYLGYDENLTVTLGNGRAYVVGQNEIRCLDLATGKRLGRQTFDGTQGPGSNQWLGLFGDRLLLSPEGQHGTQHLQLLDATDLRLIGGPWSPPNNSTTAYGVHSLAFPVVAGRLFVRGMDGLYCYDLRQKESAK